MLPGDFGAPAAFAASMVAVVIRDATESMTESVQIAASLGLWSWVAQNWAAIAIALTVASLLVFLVLLLAKYVRISLNIFIDTHPPVLLGPGVFQPLLGEEVRFRSFDGTSLRGMHLAATRASASKGTIVFCHEFGSDMYSCARYARPLIENGFDVFTFDFRGHGESSCPRKYQPLQWPSDKEMEDVLGACAYVESCLAAEGRCSDVGIFGVSRGAGAALLAASSDHNIKAIVCDGAFSTEATLMALMKKWAYIFARVKLVYEHHPDAFWRFLAWLLIRFAQPKLSRRFPSVIKALRDMQPRPILFIHGRRDSYILENQSRLLHVEAPSPKYLWLVPEARHNQSVTVEPRQYAARTVAFFRRYLADEAVGESQIVAPAEADVA
jgi:alpha-beta hydrolase superfamily lysophospholipase